MLTGSVWLPATDYIQEGTFRWLLNNEEVTSGPWEEGMPSGNRSANCLAMNRDGVYMEGPCGGQLHNMMFHTLCELPTLVWSDSQQFIPQQHKSTIIEDKNSVGTVIFQKSSQGATALNPIGGVGSKLFFVTESPVIFL